MKKGFLIVVLLALAAGLVAIFAGAEGNGAIDGPVAAPTVQPDSGTPSANPSASGSVYYLNFKPEQAAQWEALCRLYQEKTGVSVTVVTAASNTYEDTLRSEMEKAAPPTLFQVNGPVGLQSWREKCLDLTDTALYQNLTNKDFALTDGDKVAAVAYAIETYGLIYNKALLSKYCDLDGAVIQDASEIDSFDTLKAVANDIQARKEELGVKGAFACAALDSSSDWRFKTHLANLPVYYEYRADGVTSTAAIKGTYLKQYKQIFDLYLSDSTTDPALLGARSLEDSTADFTLGDAVFYQNGTWAYQDCIDAGMKDADLGMLPIFIGVDGEEDQGLCTGSENYWCINADAAPENIEATKTFLEWLITSDEGRDAMANQMAFVTPFRTFDDGYTADNALIRAAAESIAQGKTPVSWTFTTMPSEKWKSDLGAALLEYAQGTGDWANVETAFTDGWAKEYEAAGVPG